jgi:hypothetical protein
MPDLMPPPTTEWITIHDQDKPRLLIQARPDHQRCQWLVVFIRRGIRGQKILDQTAAWLSGPGCWDDSRWHPVGARLVLVPPAAVQRVEAWLRGRTL